MVDVDLSKFFDRVNHDILLDRLRKRVNDPGVIRLVRAYLNAGIMDGGVVKGDVRRAVSTKALQAFKLRNRQLTRGSVGRCMAQVVEKLRSYLLGWKGYFRLAQTPRIWHSLDEWIRRRLRMLHLRQWGRGKTIYRERVRLGASAWVAQSVAALSRRWWHNSRTAIHHVLTVAYFDRLGVPHLS